MFAAVAGFLGLREATARLLAVLLGAGLVIALCGALWARGEHFRAEAAEARGALKDQVATYRETYDRTFREHFAAKLAEEARTRHIKEKADADYFEAQLDALHAGAAYAARNQCVRGPAGADPGAAGAGDLPAAAGSSALDHGPAGPAELGIWIDQADFARCTNTAVRLGNAHWWGEASRPSGEPMEPGGGPNR